MSMKLTESDLHHATNLIDLVLDGANPSELMQNVLQEITEGEGNGPFHIGSKVKINRAVTVETVDGKSASLSQGDVVGIIGQAGPTGADRVLISGR